MNGWTVGEKGWLGPAAVLYLTSPSLNASGKTPVFRLLAAKRLKEGSSGDAGQGNSNRSCRGYKCSNNFLLLFLREWRDLTVSVSLYNLSRPYAIASMVDVPRII